MVSAGKVVHLRHQLHLWNSRCCPRFLICHVLDYIGSHHLINNKTCTSTLPTFDIYERERHGRRDSLSLLHSLKCSNQFQMKEIFGSIDFLITGSRNDWLCVYENKGMWSCSLFLFVLYMVEKQHPSTAVSMQITLFWSCIKYVENCKPNRRAHSLKKNDGFGIFCESLILWVWLATNCSLDTVNDKRRTV